MPFSLTFQIYSLAFGTDGFVFGSQLIICTHAWFTHLKIIDLFTGPTLEINDPIIRFKKV